MKKLMMVFVIMFLFGGCESEHIDCVYDVVSLKNNTIIDEYKYSHNVLGDCKCIASYIGSYGVYYKLKSEKCEVK